MKNLMLLKLACCSIILGLSACTESKNAGKTNIPEVDVRSAIDHPEGISLKGKIENPQFVILKETDDEESLVDGINDYAVTSKYIYVLPVRESRIVLFDREGNFIRTLIKEGQGPNEFAGPLAGMQVDEKNNRLYLFGSSIWTFTLNGEPVKRINSPMPMMYTRMIAPDRFAAVAMGFIPFQQGSFGIGTFKESGELLFNKNNFYTPLVPAEKTGFTANIASALSFDNQSILFKSGANDTVFRIGMDTISVACILKLENSDQEIIRGSDVTDFTDMGGLKRDGREIFVQDILETDTHFYFRCRYQGNYTILSVEKNNGELEVEHCQLPLPFKELPTLASYKYGLSGMRGSGSFPVWGSIFGNELVQAFTPAELSVYKDKGLIEIPNELKEIKEEENPVFVFYKLK